MSQVTELFEKPLLDLLFEAQRCIVSISIHVRCRSALCCQLDRSLSGRLQILPAKLALQNRLEAERLMEVEQVLESARKAKRQDRRASAWARRGRIPTNAYALPGTNGAGSKSDGAGGVLTLGTLSESQAQRLANAGLDTTTTTSTPRRSFTAISSPHALSGTP